MNYTNCPVLFENQFLQLHITTSKVGMLSSYHNTLIPALLETMGTRETSLVETISRVTEFVELHI